MRRIFFRVIFPLFLLIFVQIACAVKTDSEDTKEFVSVSDIHFNPFESCGDAAPCPLVDALRTANLSEWERVLSSYQVKPVGYGVDSNFPLFQQTLMQVNKTLDAQTGFVVVMGDLLSHDFQKHFAQYSSDKSPEGYRAFVKKTLQFIADEMAKAIPDKTIFVAVGNNDSYAEDYAYDTSHEFYHDMAQIEGSLILDPQTRDLMQQQFSRGGYYTISVPTQPGLRLVVLNTVLFSMKATGAGVDQAASDELDWLERELETHPQKTLFIMHIPAGIDVYASLKSNPVIPVESWKPDYTKRFLLLVSQHAAQITGMLAGHFHMDFLQLLASGKGAIPVSGVPAVSPLFGNNPGFKVFQYSDTTLKWLDFTTYFDSLADNAGWKQEYDFNKAYQPDCVDCSIAEGIAQIQKTGTTALFYQQFFSTGTHSQPIVQSQNWPFYWCAIQAITADDYRECVAK